MKLSEFVWAVRIITGEYNPSDPFSINTYEETFCIYQENEVIIKEEDKEKLENLGFYENKSRPCWFFYI